jgi:hypothetical protein
MPSRNPVVATSPRQTRFFPGKTREIQVQREPYDEPSHVEAEQGSVFVDGPDGVAVSMTPEAAAETSDRLLHGAAQAQGQRLAEGNKQSR